MKNAPPTDHDINNYTKEQLDQLIEAHEVEQDKIPHLTPQQVEEYSHFEPDDRPSTDGNGNGFFEKLKNLKNRLLGNSKVASAPDAPRI